MEPSSPEISQGSDPHDERELSEDKRFLRRFLKPGYGVLLVLLILLAGLMAGYGHYTDPGPLSEDKTVLIPHGGVKTVIGALQKEDILATGRASSLFFQFVTRITQKGGSLQAAEFSFPARVSIAHVLVILRHGKAVSHSLTVAEGLTAAQITRILENESLLKGKLPSVGEGTVFPQTFSYQRDTERQVILERMQHLMALTLKKIWNKRDQKALEGLITTPEQLVILASIIEKETALAAERPHVARVFLNRLKKGIKLQTDPTVIYALTQGREGLGRPLSHEDLQVSSPYNTYQIKGLPPGPICNPGLASLEAVAHPAEGDDLYFVADGRGGHNFAKTLEEQTKHVRAYRHVLKSVP